MKLLIETLQMLGVGCFWAGSEQANLLNNEMVVKKAYFPLTIGLTLIISAFFLLHGTLKVSFYSGAIARKNRVVVDRWRCVRGDFHPYLIFCCRSNLTGFFPISY